MEQKKNTKKSREKQEKSPKIPLAVMYDSMARMITGDHPSLPHLPEKFHLVRISSQQDEIVQEVGGVCYMSTDKRLAQAIIRHGTSLGIDEFAFTYDKALQCVRHWEATAKTVARPSYFKFANESGLTFHRIPFTVPEDPASKAGDNCPLFMELLSRMSNSQAFAAWLGSLFFKNSDRQQYVWMYGEGQNGKGSVAELIRYLFGDAYFAASPPSRDDKFWSYFLVNKRVVCFPDCNDNKFITSGFFKSLTGGDAVKVEKKRGGAFTVQLDCKYIINSNDKPDISGSTADLRRAIFCELQPITAATDPQYIAKLIKEAPGILAYCMNRYRKLCPSGGRIPVDVDVMTDLVDENEADMEVTFNNLFKVTESGTIEANVMTQLLKAHFPHPGPRALFRRFILRKKGVEYSRPRRHKHDTKRPFRWSGIRLISVEEKVPNLDKYREFRRLESEQKL